ncbi:hypothetical protein D3C80_541260 [compost metagenome]
MNVCDRRIIEIFAEDEGRQQFQEIIAGSHVTRHRTRLDVGGTLPVLPPALVVDQGCIHGDGERRRAGVRPQPQVGSENVAIGRAVLQDTDQPAHHPAIDLRRIERIGKNAHLRIEENDDIDVGGIVEFSPAELAHAEHDEARATARLRGIDKLQLAAFMGREEKMVDRGGDGGLRKFAQPACRLLRREDAGKIGQRQDEAEGALGRPKHGHDLALGRDFSVNRPPRTPRLVDQRGERRLHRLADCLRQK